jgi:hypothetical protein
MATLDLASLATETSQRLHALWDEMGVPSDARGAALEQLAHDVAAIYSSRVAAEASRKSGIEGEIASLQTTIDNMIHAMDEAAGVVRAPQGPECSAGGRRTERSAPHGRIFGAPLCRVSSRDDQPPCPDLTRLPLPCYHRSPQATARPSSRTATPSRRPARPCRR